MARVKKKRVVVVPSPGVFLLDIAGPCDVFAAADKALDEKGGYEVELVSPLATKTIGTRGGVDLLCRETIKTFSGPVDTLIVAGFPIAQLETSGAFIAWLRDIYPQVRRIASICVGAYALAEAGILEGRQATTHWEYSQHFRQRYPDIQVDTNPFFTRDSNIYTSGGVSSGIDLSIAMVEEDHGRCLALAVARKLVLQLKRPGYQSQFASLLEMQRLENTLGGRLYAWMVRRLEEDLSLEQLAEHSNMSVRNFARVFLKETGLTPAKFVEKVRVEIARKYLEDSDLSLDQIAVKCGLGGMLSMRRTFLRHMMISPSDYRRSFRSSLHSIED
ncbi:MAG: helix-turn-helix domain-containing protein [Bacteroidetes bacterium]|nr:helix-turn-helix domain-containing protein [Bacteroidota bacterium]